MRSRKFLFDIVFRYPGRVDNIEAEQIEPRYIAYWKSAVAPLSKRTYEHKGCAITVEVDWGPYARRIARDFKIMAPVLSGESDNEDWYRKISRPLRLKASCVLKGSNELVARDWYPAFFLEYFIYEVFAISNLACPGSAEFHAVSIICKKTRTVNEPRLSAYYFDEWMIESVRGNQPSARILSPEIAAQWFFAVNPSVAQKAESPTQRALYALFHLCKNDGRIDFVMWLFNALESLLSTRVGENFSGLIRRASLVLSLDEKEAAALSSRLQKLYKLRSSFVHGGYEVAHPIHAETIDERLNDHYDRVLQQSTYGFIVLASLLQRMIEMNRTTLAFEEVLKDA